MAFTAKPFVAARPAAACRLAPRVAPVHASKLAEPAVLAVKGFDGSDAGSANLALKVAGEITARHVVHRYLVMVRQNARSGNAHTKTRAEVRGGGKKPFAQKGTGNARMGSKRSPLIPGGGVSFGPRTKDWSISMNKKERRLALATALQSAASDIVVVDSLEGKMPDKKTKSLVNACAAMGVDVMKTHTLIITADTNQEVNVSGKNIAKLKINCAKSLQMYDVLRADKIILEAGALEHINSFYQ